MFLLIVIFHFQKVAIFDCVGLTTHQEASEVLLSTCERRVKSLAPLFQTSPISPPSQSPSGEALAKALAPSPVKRNLSRFGKENLSTQSAVNEIQQKIVFLRELGLSKQTFLKGQCKSDFYDAYFF